MKKKEKSVGTSLLRKEGAEKVKGTAKYVDDLSFPNMLYGTTVRSSCARGRLIEYAFKQGIPWDEFVIVAAKDIPGKNIVTFIDIDQPYLVESQINHPEEAILLLAHEDKSLLEEARRLVELRVEAMNPVLSIEESLHQKEIIWGRDNVLKSYLVEKGDIDKVWNNAAFVVEGEYITGLQEQLYIENNGMIAKYDKKNGITIWGSMQCPYYVQKAVMGLLDLPPEKVRIVQAETGGGFGGKEDFPSLIAGHAALLSWKASGRPVKLIYDRAEDMAATTKRHPSITKHKTAIDRDGKLLGMDIDFVLDGGAYSTLSSVVLSRGLLHATGPYYCPNVRINAHAVATNTPPNGAFRGFGAPQSVFAIERHMEKIAKISGIASDELRRRNVLKNGDMTATKQVIRDDVHLDQMINKALKVSRFHEKKAQFEKENRKNPSIKRGMGFSCFVHGAGFTGSGEKYLASVAGVELTKEGRVRVLAANTEIGQGKNTIFSQIVADALSIDPDLIEVAQPDTAVVPNSGPTVASRTTMIVGKLIEDSAKELKLRLQEEGFLKRDQYSKSQFISACQSFLKKQKTLKILKQYNIPPEIKWNEKLYEGDAYGTFAWAVYVAEVTVDLTTYQAKVDRFWALQEIGKVVNPILAEGQIEGGVVQGIGYALYEKVRHKEGRVINNQFANYIVLTSADVPEIKVLFEEVPYRHGPQGAKGIGELPLDGTAPAVLNGVSQALQIEFNEIPLLPEEIMKRSRSKVVR